MTFASVEPRRRCACCRAPSNRCPCRVCGSCSTSGHAPEVAPCACGSKAPPPPGAWDHPTQTNDMGADLRTYFEQAERESAAKLEPRPGVEAFRKRYELARERGEL